MKVRARSAVGVLGVAAISAIGVTGAARANHIGSTPGFGSESLPAGTAVVQTTQPPAVQPPVVIQPGQSVVVQPGPSGSVVVQPGQSGGVVVQPGQSGSVVVQPGGSRTVVTPAPQMVQAEDLEANEVRAQTIYANKIEASEIRGTIHQTGKVKLDRSVTDLKAPTVVASLLYADTIKAHTVIADHIFVRDLERR
jgi:hypothetical protein